MLEVVDDLERNGQNLQHFSRELARYFRNLLVARISGAETRLIAASAAQRTKLAEIASHFSEEDLTRFMQLSLEIFSDLQASLQPRFHLEIGLVRLVYAGRLLPIEQALAGIGPKAAEPPEGRTTRSASGPPAVKTDEGVGRGPGGPPHQGAADTAAVSDWRARLHKALMELGMPYTADAVENARVVEVNGELQFTAGKADLLALRPEDLQKAVKHIGQRPMRIKVIPGNANAPAERIAPAAGGTEDEATSRALANPEVQRFKEVFGGEIRKVRNLKE
jgi:DNA polymerase-3 subunit gamma/tau